ncbi:MAG TPA: flagellar hook-associated protein FlgK [Gemmatimonadaceae bacterium]|jgi:flagellar hook-associated protein 1 FlgK
MSIGSILNMARSGMNVQMAAIQTASQNISNASTDGYSKQSVETATALPTVFPYGSIGTGVEITGITRARDTLLDTTYRSDAASSSAADTTSSALTQIQSVFNEPSDTGLSATLDKFFTAWSDLSNDPTNGAAKSVVVAAGANVASTLNGFASQLNSLDQTNREAINADVDKVNELTGQIADLNTHIISAESNGTSANDLRDERDRLVDQVASITGGQTVERSNGSIAVYVGGRMIVDGATSKQLISNDDAPPTISYGGGTLPLSGIGGSLGAELNVSGTIIPGTMAKLDTLAKGIVQGVNAVHSSGTVYSGSPLTGSAAGNFFDQTIPPPAGGDPSLTAAGIKLDASLTSDTVAASGGSSTGPGDNSVALAISNLRDTAQTLTDASGATVATRSVDDYYTSIVGDVASSTSQANDDSTVQSTLLSNAEARRQSVSGVSTDEELIDVIQHQHSYQAAARLVNVVDDMMQTLVSLGQ